MKKYSEYSRGRMEGMAFALSVVEGGGVEALRKEVALRGATGINPNHKFADLDAQVDSITAWALKRTFILSVASIHDAYGIGPTRMQKYFDAFSEATRLLMKGRHGGAFWTDYASEIRKIYGVELSANTEGVIIRDQKTPAGHPTEGPKGKGKAKAPKRIKAEGRDGG